MKSLKAAVILALTALALTPNVASAKWVHLLNSQSGNKLLIGNMWKEGNVVNFWKTIAEPGDERPIAELIGADCNNSQFQILQRTDGVNVSTTTFSVQQAPAGSMIAAAINYACAEAH